jgi:dynein light intermediate chain 1
VLREGFDVELASNGWTIDLQQELGDTESHTNGLETQSNGEDPGYGHIAPEGSAVDLYEAAVPDPTMDALHRAGRMTLPNRLEIETTETQVFLGQQLKVLESYRLKHEAMLREEARSRNGKPSHEDYYNGLNPEPKVLEHIGPVQFNMGGIQVDADDMVQRLKVSFPSDPFSHRFPLTTLLQERQTYDSSPPSPEDRDDGPQMDTENLQAFFQGLMARRGGPGN